MWGASGRSQTLGRSDGLTKLVLEPGTERVLGVGIAGPGAGELIAEGTLAELRALFPPTTVEYVEKQPTLEEIFLAIVGSAGPLSEEES